MAKMLDVLEAFLNLHGHTYMRLDGSTKPEQRQVRRGCTVYYTVLWIHLSSFWLHIAALCSQDAVVLQ